MSFGQRMGITGSCSLLPAPVPNGSLHISALLPSVRFTPGQTLPSWRPMSSRPTPPMLATTGQREFTIPSSYKESPNFLTCGSYPDLTIIVCRKIKIEYSAWEQRQMWTLPRVLKGKSRCCYHKRGRIIVQAKIIDTTTLAKI